MNRWEFKIYCCSVAESCPTLCEPVNCNMPGFSVLQGFVQIHVRWVNDAIQLSHPLSVPSPLALNLSQHQGLFYKKRPNESALHIRWPKYSSFNISPSSEYSRLISFRIDWFDLLAVPGPLRSFLQHHNWKASVLWHSAFFIVQLLYPYMTTGKTIALITQTIVSKIMSLLFNMLWLQSQSIVILDVQKRKSIFVHFFPFYLPRSEGIRCHHLSFLNAGFQASFFTFLFHLYQDAL